MELGMPEKEALKEKIIALTKEYYLEVHGKKETVCPR